MNIGSIGVQCSHFGLYSILARTHHTGSGLELHSGIDGNCRRALSICHGALLFFASSTAFQCRDALFPCCCVPFSCNQPSPNHPRPRSPSDHQHGNTTNLFRSIDTISSNCKCLGAPPWRVNLPWHPSKLVENAVVASF